MKRTCFCKTRYLWGSQGAQGGYGRAELQLPSLVPAFQVEELERKVRCQQEQLFQTRQELTSTSAELKMRAIQAEGGHGQACCGRVGDGHPGDRVP